MDKNINKLTTDELKERILSYIIKNDIFTCKGKRTFTGVISINVSDDYYKVKANYIDHYIFGNIPDTGTFYVKKDIINNDD